MLAIQPSARLLVLYWATSIAIVIKVEDRRGVLPGTLTFVCSSSPVILLQDGIQTPTQIKFQAIKHVPQVGSASKQAHLRASTRILALPVVSLYICAPELVPVLQIQQLPLEISSVTSNLQVVVVPLTLSVITWQASTFFKKNFNISPFNQVLLLLSKAKKRMRQLLGPKGDTPLPLVSLTKLQSVIKVLIFSPFGKTQMMVRAIVVLMISRQMMPPNSDFTLSYPARFRLILLLNRSNSEKMSLWVALLVALSIRWPTDFSSVSSMTGPSRTSITEWASELISSIYIMTLPHRNSIQKTSKTSFGKLQAIPLSTIRTFITRRTGTRMGTISLIGGFQVCKQNFSLYHEILQVPKLNVQASLPPQSALISCRHPLETLRLLEYKLYYIWGQSYRQWVGWADQGNGERGGLVDRSEVGYNLIIEMFHQEDAQGGGLQVHLNLQEQPQWLDDPSIKLKKKKTQKPLPPIVPPADPLLEELQVQLQQSKRGLPRGTINQIKTRAEQLEYGVFVGQTTSNKEQYFGALIEHNSPNPYVQQEISQTVQQTHRQLQKEIHRNNIDMSNRVIPKNKGHLKQLEHQDQYRLIQLKQGEIKSKLGSLRKEMHKETIKDKLRNKIETISQEHLDKDFYSIDHPRTKEAENFVRDLQARRKDEQRELQYQMTLKQEADMRRRQQDTMQKEAERQQRKTKLQEYYQSRLVQRLEEKERERQKRQEYQEWVKSFQREKPLQLEKEEEFRMKVVIPQLEEQHKKLMTIKAEHRPIDPEEINDHQEKYLQFKKDNAIRKRAEIELKQEEQQQEIEDINEKLFKGKYRYLVLEQMIEEKYPLNPKDLDQSKKDRIRAYNEHLRSFHQDHYTQKQQRIEAETISNQKFVKRVRNMNGSMNITNRQQDAQQLNSDRPERKSAEDADHYKQGIQNLAYLKSMVREQQAREVAPPKINIIEEKEIKVKGYLEEQRQRHESNKKKEAALSREIQETAATANEEIDAMKAKAEMLDQRLKRKEVRLKNLEQAKLGEGQRVEEDYVHAIKAKIHMLNQFD